MLSVPALACRRPAPQAASIMTVPQLTGAQKSALRSLGQKMECSLVIGRAGLTSPVLADLKKQLAARELVKVKLLAERADRTALCAEIETKIGAIEAGSVGKTALFFRQNPDPKKQVIELPPAKARLEE